MHFDFNKSNNFDLFKQQYQLDKRLRINEVLASSQAEALRESLSKLQYTHAFFQSLYSDAAKGVEFFSTDINYPQVQREMTIYSLMFLTG
ncbi:MAG: hypothetical protein ACI88A_002050 [Paraglaciecola sp.]|jgi:hypothetical protein